MKRVALTLATLLALAVAATPPTARADTPIGGPKMFTYGVGGPTWGGNLYAVRHHHHGHHYGYYGGWSPPVVRPPVWAPPVVVPFAAPPAVIYLPTYGAPDYYYGSPYSFQYYGPRFSLGFSF